MACCFPYKWPARSIKFGGVECGPRNRVGVFCGVRKSGQSGECVFVHGAGLLATYCLCAYVIRNEKSRALCPFATKKAGDAYFSGVLWVGAGDCGQLGESGGVTGMRGGIGAGGFGRRGARVLPCPPVATWETALKYA